MKLKWSKQKTWPLHFLPCPGTFSIFQYQSMSIQDWAPEASSVHDVHVQTCQDALHPPRVFTPKCSKSFRPPLRNGWDLSWWHPNSHHRQNLINKNHAFINAQYEIIQKNSLFPELMFVQSFLEQLTSLGVQNKTVQLAETRKTPRGLGMFEMFGCVPLHVMWSCVPGNAGKKKHSALRSISPRFRSLETAVPIKWNVRRINSKCSRNFERISELWESAMLHAVYEQQRVSGCFWV